MKENDVAIITTVANFDLYSKTAKFFPNVPRYVIDGSNGMHGLDSIFYMFRRLKGRGINWLIMADEDVIFPETSNIFTLIRFMKDNKYLISGVRDGGVIPHRKQNPSSINTFFSVMNFSEIEKIFDTDEIKKNGFVSSGEFRDNLKRLKYPYDNISLFEPYYSFYFWLRRKGYNFLFLDAQIPFKGDGFTNSVHMPDGALLLYHTWYARSYGTNEKHTKRINNVLKNLNIEEGTKAQPLIFKDRFFSLKSSLQKIFRKLNNKIRR